jgi:hypothetical protein
MDTWETVHAGDIVLGHDGQSYGVQTVVHGDPRGPVVTLVRHGQITGPAQPPRGTPITVLQRSDMAAEAAAFHVLEAAGFGPELLRETL